AVEVDGAPVGQVGDEPGGDGPEVLLQDERAGQGGRDVGQELGPGLAAVLLVEQAGPFEGGGAAGGEDEVEGGVLVVERRGLGEAEDQAADRFVDRQRDHGEGRRPVDEGTGGQGGVAGVAFGR